MRVLGLLMALLLALAACGGEAIEEKKAANGDVYSTQDVAFAQHMIQHHAQALAMVDLLQGREVSPELTTLSEGILTSQTAEIETMTTWLTDWDEEIPETVRDHVNAGHGDEGHSGHGADEQTGAGMPGMLSGEQLDEVESAKGAAFERAWAEAMIEHHEGAIEMAEEQQEKGRFTPAVDLAGQVIEAQDAEIQELQKLAG